MPLGSRSQRAAIRPMGEWERLLRIHSGDDGIGHNPAYELHILPSLMASS
jgi:hypothetical protein